jgi:hypothetical protein
MRRLTASLLFLALVVGFSPPPAQAFLGIDLFDPTKPFMIAELGKILTEVQRLKKVVAQAKASYEFLQMQKYRIGSLGIQMTYFSPSPLTILTGRACLATTWDRIFNSDIGGSDIDQVFATIRRAGELGCPGDARLSPDTRNSNHLIAALELVTANGMNVVADNSTNSPGAAAKHLLDAISGDGEGEGATTDAQKLAAANGILATQIRAATAIEAEHLTMSTLRAQRVRDQIAAHVNSQLLRQRTHAGNFAAIQAR